jgi:DNA-binding response OmpR family regulator
MTMDAAVQQRERGAPRILLIEDEPMVQRFVSRALAADGFAVERSSDGVEGLELAKGGAYDLVLLDLRLPSIDGVAVLRGIMAARPDQRVFVLSALRQESTKVRCLQLGATDYLAKPFALAELLARVRARLREPAIAPRMERMLRVGSLTLELRRRVADGGSGPVSLSEREFLLLQHLMRRRDDVCTREQLLADVWGFDSGTNVVDVYVRRLRAKLGSDVIETVWNVGYALKPT